MTPARTQLRGAAAWIVRLPIKKMQEILNAYGADGWDVSFMLVEKKRMLLFWALPGLACDFSLSGIEVEASEVEEHVVLEALPVAVAA